jgi:uncharacterized protein (TIGR03000 family)
MLRVPVLLLLLGGFFIPAHAARSQDGDKAADSGKERKKTPANLKILIHPEAKLTVEETQTKSTGGERLFVTPPLDAGKTYAYTLKWTYPDGGSAVTRMAVIQFQADKEKTIDLRPGSKEVLSSQIIYVPTDQAIVDKMLEMAKITKDDVVYDLGCGDARILVTAAKKYGARGVGVDIDPARIKDSNENVKANKLKKLIEIRQGDALRVADISKATVVTLYMLPEFQQKLAPILKRELKPGTRVVAHDYWLPGWDAVKTEEVPGIFREHTVYLYRVGATKKNSDE